MSQASASRVAGAWTQLFARLVGKYHDGLRLSADPANYQDFSAAAEEIFYPHWWLEEVGYYSSADNSTAFAHIADPSSLPPLKLALAGSGKATNSRAMSEPLHAARLGVGVGVGVGVGAAGVLRPPVNVNAAPAVLEPAEGEGPARGQHC